MTARALPPLLPAPKRTRVRAGRFVLTDGAPLVLPASADGGDVAAARALRAHVKRLCGVTLRTRRRADGGAGVRLRRRGRHGEAYRLEVSPEGVLLDGDGPAGLRYAVETLAQLVDARGGVPGCVIEDAPDLGNRGVMLDVSRGKVPTLDTLKEVVDRCVGLKLNVLMLYTEHTFRFRRHPRIGAGCSPLSAREMQALDEYAAQRHVELVPTLQSLGHMEHVLDIPRYAPLAETERHWSLAPANPATYALLDDLYADYLPNFRSLRFNANCDEPFDLGRGQSRARAQQIGAGGLFLEHVARVRRLAARHGKRTLMLWSDFLHGHPDRIADVPRNLVLLDWWYEAGFDFDRVKRFADRGLDFWGCPGTSSWNCLFPRMENSLANISGYAAAVRRHGGSGLLVTDWGDFGHYNLQGNSWLALAWAAQEAWSGRSDAKAFDRAFSRRWFGDARGRAAGWYRKLGAVHDAGFVIPNGSPLQYLYFDDLDRATFLKAARRGALRRAGRRLEALRDGLAAARDDFGDDELTWRELLHAADASCLAVRKGLAALEVLAWRRRPRRLDARGRRRLARECRALADEQTRQGRRLRQLWLRRSKPSNFEITAGKLRRSTAGLRRAARQLEHDRPAAPPPPHAGFEISEVAAWLSEGSRRI